MRKLLVAAIILAGCAPAPKATPVTTALGKPGFQVKCKQPRENCISKAAEACGGKFFIVTQSSHAGGALADALPGPVTWYDMTVQCGPPEGY